MIVLAVAVIIAAIIVSINLDSVGKRISRPLLSQADELEKISNKLDLIRHSIARAEFVIDEELKEIKEVRDEKKRKDRIAEKDELARQIADGSARVFEG